MHPLTLFTHCPACGSSNFNVNDPKSKRCNDCGFVYYLNPSAATAAFILNENNELLVVVRRQEPAKGTYDLPGGFSDMDETAEQGIAREVKEETNLDVTGVQYLFSRPNIYPYSGFDVHTLDLFFLCRASNYQQVKACDDAASFRWIPLKEVNPMCFGLTSIRQGVEQFLKLNARVI